MKKREYGASDLYNLMYKSDEYKIVINELKEFWSNFKLPKKPKGRITRIGPHYKFIGYVELKTNFAVLNILKTTPKHSLSLLGVSKLNDTIPKNIKFDFSAFQEANGLIAISLTDGVGEDLINDNYDKIMKFIKDYENSADASRRLEKFMENQLKLQPERKKRGAVTSLRSTLKNVSSYLTEEEIVNLVHEEFARSVIEE